MAYKNIRAWKWKSFSFYTLKGRPRAHYEKLAYAILNSTTLVCHEKLWKSLSLRREWTEVNARGNGKKWEEWGGPCDHPREINERRTNGHGQMSWWRHRDMFRRVDLVSGRCRDWIWFGTEKLNAVMSGHWCEGREDMFVFVSLYLNLWRPRLVTSIWMSGRECCWRW